jgi:hypothetical protein
LAKILAKIDYFSLLPIASNFGKTVGILANWQKYIIFANCEQFWQK